MDAVRQWGRVASALSMCAGLGAVGNVGLAAAAEPKLRLVQMDDARAALEAIPEAIRALTQGDYTAAESAFDALIAKLPAVDRASAAARLLGLPNAQAYRRIVSSLHNNLGLSRFRARDFTGAAAAYRAAIRADPGAAAPYENLGVLRLRTRAFRDAARLLEAARSRAMLDGRGFLHLGAAYLGRGDLVKARWALVQCEIAVRAASTPEAWGTGLEAARTLARLDFTEGHLSVARVALETVLDRAPGDVEARYLLIQVLAREGQVDAAREQEELLDRYGIVMAGIQGALAATPGRVQAIRWVGDAYRDVGLYHLASVRYRQLLARDPADTHARLALASLVQRINSHRTEGRGGPS